MKSKTGISPWLAAAREALSADGLSPEYHREAGDFRYNVYNEGNALWVVVCWRNDCRAALRTAFAPEGKLQLTATEEEENGAAFFLKTIIGSYVVTLQFPAADKPLLRCITTLTPGEPLVSITFQATSKYLSIGSSRQSAKGKGKKLQNHQAGAGKSNRLLMH